MNTRASERQEPREVYEARLERLSQEGKEWSRRSGVFFNLRGLSFGALALGAIGWLTTSDGAWGWGCLVCAVLLGGFIVEYARVTERERMVWRSIRVHREALQRCSPRFDERADDGADFMDTEHPYSDDLDLFGKGSLFQLMSVARTQFGRRCLASYLQNRGTPREVGERQGAARELEPMLDARLQLEAMGMPAVDPRERDVRRTLVDPEPLLRWAEAEPQLLPRRALVVACTLSPVLVLGWLGWSWWRGLPTLTCFAPLGLQALIVAFSPRYINDVFGAVSSHQGAFLQYSPMLRVLESLPAEAPLLRSLKQRTETRGRSASETMRRFEHIVAWFEVRHNDLGHLAINVLLLWDIHCVLMLERWAKQAGGQLRDWFQALGELEALSSLSAFAFDHPEYAWPELLPEGLLFEAEGLGHPLIAEGRVACDVELSRTSAALLVTGSNMSGKSTLLRAIGINAVLAQAGAPVCARRLWLSPLEVRTSIQISDSLSQGVSGFYAEIKKLKTLLGALRGEAPPLYLLDEILRGTNSRERGVGARWILAQLLRGGAIGAISTHDLGLCRLEPEQMAHVKQVHFREAAEDGRMSFDYKLRPGPVQAGNALRLMRQRGIRVPS